jgi:hypothetical protein
VTLAARKFLLVEQNALLRAHPTLKRRRQSALNVLASPSSWLGSMETLQRWTKTTFLQTSLVTFLFACSFEWNRPGVSIRYAPSVELPMTIMTIIQGASLLSAALTFTAWCHIGSTSDQVLLRKSLPEWLRVRLDFC